MSIDKCRICRSRFLAEPLLNFVNMPAAAQYLPDAKSIEQDKGIDLHVCQCVGCGLVQLSSGPVHYYRDVIRASAYSKEMKKFRIHQFAGFIDKYSLKHKKIIEIGAGRGEYLSLLCQLEVEASGIENLDKSVNSCLKEGLNVKKGFIDSADYRLTGAPYDAFMILNFLEHLPDPNSTLSGICGNLNDDAVGLVEVPNFDMMIRENLFSEFIPDHLLYFTRNTMNTVLNMNGFEVVECNEVWHDYIISAVVRKRKKLNMEGFHEGRKKLEKQLNSFISRFEPRRVAIWGAGHQAFAVIAMTGISGKIKYLVDSAPFKQDKYTPTTHIPILRPETLNTDPVDAVIIMAASYSDEIAAIIRNKYNKNIIISILRENFLELV